MTCHGSAAVPELDGARAGRGVEAAERPVALRTASDVPGGADRRAYLQTCRAARIHVDTPLDSSTTCAPASLAREDESSRMDAVG